MENVDKKNIGLPSRYVNALYELCDEAKNLKNITHRQIIFLLQLIQKIKILRKQDIGEDLFG